MSKEQRTTRIEPLKIGSRGSPLALKQVEMVRAALSREWPELKTELVVIQTSGDWKPEDGDVRLSESAGGKGQFAKEIEEALLAGAIDCAVHSMKDMDSYLPDGLVINHMLPREDVRDAFLFSDSVRGEEFNKLNCLSDNSQKERDVFSIIPERALVGTASVRRGAFLLSKRPDLTIEPFRGNVHTRIEKVRGGQVDMTLLAIAGLKRLGIGHEVDVILDVEEMLPAAGQGAVGIEVRDDDDHVLSIFGRISHYNTVLCVKAEREALRVLDGSCHSPIGAYAMFEKSEDGAAENLASDMWLRVCVASLDGQQIFEGEHRSVVTSVEDAVAMGAKVAERLLMKIPDGILQD